MRHTHTRDHPDHAEHHEEDDSSDELECDCGRLHCEGTLNLTVVSKFIEAYKVLKDLVLVVGNILTLCVGLPQRKPKRRLDEQFAELEKKLRELEEKIRKGEEDKENVPPFERPLNTSTPVDTSSGASSGAYTTPDTTTTTLPDSTTPSPPATPGSSPGPAGHAGLNSEASPGPRSEGRNRHTL